MVKGVHFVNLRDAGDPVEQARLYDRAGADELVFLDISASNEGRETTVETVRRVADQVFMPLTVGGGIRTVEDIRRLLLAGADKVSLNTAAVRNPDLLREGAERFGSQCIVLAIDARRVARRRAALGSVHPRRAQPHRMDALEWVGGRADRRRRDPADQHGCRRHPGRLRHRADPRARPSGQCAGDRLGRRGQPAHFAEVLTAGKADAALAASLFHDGVLKIPELKTYLAAARAVAKRWCRRSER